MKNTTWLTGLYVACELIANTTANKRVALPGGAVVQATVREQFDDKNEQMLPNSAAFLWPTSAILS